MRGRADDRRSLKVNGEFYVAPAYNMLIEQGARIGIHSVGAVGEGMYGLGTPADLKAFLDCPAGRRALQPGPVGATMPQ